MKKLIPFSIVILFIATQSFGQKAELSLISTTGGYLKTDNINLSWSLGEIVTETFSSNDIFLTQGFQQPDDFSTSIKTLKKESLSIQVYPNPSSTHFFIELPKSKYQSNKYKVHIYDAHGKIIMVKTIDQQLNNIDMQNWLSGIYFIKITNIDSEVNKTIVLQKINN